VSKLVILGIGEGSFEQGFPVSLEIFVKGHQLLSRKEGDLPAELEIPPIFRKWQLAYRSLDLNNRSSFLEAPESQITNISIEENIQSCDQVAQILQARLIDWYESVKFKKIRELLLGELNKEEDIRIVVRTQNLFLWRLPWHLFFKPFLDEFRRAEVAVSMQEYEGIFSSIDPKPEIKLLAILGDSTGINTDSDRESLKALPNVACEFLAEPHKEDLSDQLWLQDWQILFFAGHSTSQGETGRLFINQTESLTVAELKHSLRNAIARGLQLAIFNSCDGLQLARDLAELHIPQIIVMREPVPDRIAQDFLKYFLKFYTNGESLYVSVRKARERLAESDKFPCASWLPTICQNPAETPPTWGEIRIGRKREEPPIPVYVPSRIPIWRVAIATSAIVTGLLMGIRQLGLLEYSELQAFDRMVRLKPDEGPDPRLLVVKIGEEDIQTLKQAIPTDRTLIDLLKKLEAHRPRVIGLDILRDDTKKASEASRYFAENDGLVIICKVGDRSNLGNRPPEGLPIERQGFNDLITDPIDDVVRRQLLTLNIPSNSLCRTEMSLSLQIAFYFLAAQNIQPQIDKEYLQLGNVVFNRLEGNVGGYASPDIKGLQILVNWRSPENAVRQITLTQALNGDFDPAWVKDKAVLIGYDALSKKDYSSTPYSAGQRPFKQMPGVLIHAQMTSQILAAVLDGRPLLQPMPLWGDVLWIFGWSAIGGMVAVLWQRRIIFSIVSVSGLVTLSIVSFGLFCGGVWVAIVPAIVAFAGTTGVVVLWIWRSQR